MFKYRLAIAVMLDALNTRVVPHKLVQGVVVKACTIAIERFDGPEHVGVAG